MFYRSSFKWVDFAKRLVIVARISSMKAEHIYLENDKKDI